MAKAEFLAKRNISAQQSFGSAESPSKIMSNYHIRN